MYANKIVKNVEFNRKINIFVVLCYFVFLTCGKHQGTKVRGQLIH